ncbi:CCNY, partial [Symbiodinium microadriaticum]
MRKYVLLVQETIFSFVHTLCAQSQMEYECAVLSFLYLERVIRMSHGMFKLDNGNWKGPVLSCMIMANKVWDDFHMSNVDYVFIFPSLTLQRINELELQLLRVLNANLWVGVGEYAEIDKVSNHMAQGLVKRASFHERKRPKRTRVLCATSTDEERTLVIACGSDQSSLSTSNTNRVGSAAVQTSYPGDSEEGEE